MQRKEEQLAVSDPQNTIFAMNASKNVTNIYSSSFERSYCSNFVSFSLKMSVILNNTKPYNCKKKYDLGEYMVVIDTGIFVLETIIHRFGFSNES